MAIKSTKAGGKKTGASKAKKMPSTWTVHGVSKRTRSTVARAAKKDEMPIGKWVDRTLGEAAKTRLKGDPPGLALPPELLNTLSELSENLKTLSEQRTLGSQAIQQVQKTATEFGEQVFSTYAALIKRADAAIDDVRSWDVRSWTDEPREEVAKWGTRVIEELKGVAGGIERLQNLVGLQESGDRRGGRPGRKPSSRKPARKRKTKSSSPKTAKGTVQRSKTRKKRGAK